MMGPGCGCRRCLLVAWLRRLVCRVVLGCVVPFEHHPECFNAASRSGTWYRPCEVPRSVMVDGEARSVKVDVRKRLRPPCSRCGADGTPGQPLVK